MEKRFVLILLSVLLVVSNGFALDNEPKPFEMDEVVVTSTNKAKAFDTPSSIAIITAKDLEDSGAKNIIEVLENIPGIINKTYNNEGIAIRGTQSSMAGGPVILIDGVPQKIGDTQYDSFGFIPVSQVERIEVLKSPGIVYGPGSARGVINIITKKGEKENFSGNIKLSYGSWDTIDTNATISGNKHKFDYLINAGIFKTDGYEDEGVNKTSSLIKFGYKPNDYTRIGLRGNLILNDAEVARGREKNRWHIKHFRRKKQFPRSATDPRLVWYNKKDHTESVLGLEFSHDKDALFLNSNVSYTKYEANYKSQYSINYKPKTVFHEDENQSTYAFNFSGGYNLSLDNFIYTPSFGVNMEQINFDQQRNYPFNPKKKTGKYIFDVNETMYGLFWDNDFLFKEKYGLKIGARIDQVNVEFEDKAATEIDQSETFIGWSIAPSYYFTTDANIYFQISKNFWMPTPAYYAWAASRGKKGGITINTADSLKPEESLTYEIGYKHMVNKNIRFILTGFFIDYKDKFASVYHSNAAMTWGGMKNIGSAEMKGIELEADGRPCNFFGYRLSGTYLDAKWKSGQMKVYERPGNTKVLCDLDGYQIYGIPKYTATAGFDFYPMEKLKISADINYFGPHYADYTNKVKYSAKTTFDTKVTYTINNSWEVWLLGKNIFDQNIERVSNTTARINTATGAYANTYYVQDGAYFEAGLNYSF